MTGEEIRSVIEGLLVEFDSRGWLGASRRAVSLFDDVIDASRSDKDAEAARTRIFGSYAPGTKSDPVNHPSHYTTGKIEVIDFIEDQKLDFHLGSVVQYIARCAHKGDELGDLKKANWYLERAIALREGKHA